MVAKANTCPTWPALPLPLASALFLEVHDNPAEALSDGPNMVRLDNLKKLLSDVLAIDKIVRG